VRYPQIQQNCYDWIVNEYCPPYTLELHTRFNSPQVYLKHNNKPLLISIILVAYQKEKSRLTFLCPSHFHISRVKLWYTSKSQICRNTNALKSTALNLLYFKLVSLFKMSSIVTKIHVYGSLSEPSNINMYTAAECLHGLHAAALQSLLSLTGSSQSLSFADPWQFQLLKIPKGIFQIWEKCSRLINVIILIFMSTKIVPCFDPAIQSKKHSLMRLNSGRKRKLENGKTSFYQLNLLEKFLSGFERGSLTFPHLPAPSQALTSIT